MFKAKARVNMKEEWKEEVVNAAVAVIVPFTFLAVVKWVRKSLIK